MTRRLTLLLATIAFAVTAQATTPMTHNESNAALNPSATLPVDEDAEEEDVWSFWWEAGANITSNYLWRGYDQPYSGNMFDPAIQPSVTLGYGLFYVDLWYNISTMSTYQELDMTLGFDYKNLSITVYDVWCDYGDAFWKNDFLDDQNHSLTATIEYTFFDRLRLHWGTTFLHSADWLYNEDGSRQRRAFSSYFEIAYTQPVKDLFDIEIVAGASPWTGPFWCAGPRALQADGSYALDFENIPEGFNVKRHYALIKTGVAF